MTHLTNPLDAAIAHSLNSLTIWAADELIARIAAKSEWRARIGISNQSCSTYVDIDAGDDETRSLCIRISDHEAMSYNRAGDFNIGFDRFRDASTHIALTALYDGEESYPIEFDEDGEPEVWSLRHFLTEEDGATDDNGYWTSFDHAGYQFDADALDAAISRALTFAEKALTQ